MPDVAVKFGRAQAHRFSLKGEPIVPLAAAARRLRDAPSRPLCRPRFLMKGPALSIIRLDSSPTTALLTQALDDRVTHRQGLQADLREFLATGHGLEVHYQPLVGISSGQVEG